MTILFVANTIADFDSSSERTQDELSYTSGSGVSYSFALDGYAGTLTGGLVKTLDSLQTGTVWCGFFRQGEIGDAAGANWDLTKGPDTGLMTFWDGEGNPIIYWNYNISIADPYKIQARVYLRDGTTQDITDIPIYNIPEIIASSLTPDRWDMSVTPGTGFKLYYNRALVYEYTGNVGNSLSTTNGIGKISVGRGDDWATDLVVSQFAVATTDTRFMRSEPVVLSTTASSDTSSAAGSLPITTVTDNQSITYYTTNAYNLFDANGESIVFPENDTITLQDGYAIAGVVLSYQAFETGSSPVATLTPTLNISSTNYTGTGMAVTTGLKNHQYVFTTNPATSNAWTESDLEGLGYGVTANT